MSIDNPFYHRGAIRNAAEFHGRDAEIAEILGLLRKSQSVSMIGPRRIGKSSLLLHLCRLSVREPLGLGNDRALFVPIDCQELGGSPPDEVYDVLHTGLLDAAAEAGLTLSGFAPGTYRSLDRSLHQIAQAGMIVVVLLDEFELLAANERLTPYFFARLRGLTTKHGLAYITASQRPLYAISADEEVLSSPFFNIFVTLSLGLYPPDEAAALLTSRLADTPVSFSLALREHLLDLVGLHPFFLHVAGYHAFQALSQERELDSAESLRQLDDAIAIESDSHLSYLWNNLSREEQYTLATCEGPIDAVRLLDQQCLLVQRNGRYDYASQLLHRFVRRQQVNGLIQADPFVIDPQRHQVKANNEDISLTNSQFDLLRCMAERAGQVVHGEDLERAVWGDVLVDDPDRLKTLIKRLRRAIEPYGNWIVSERGVGYALRPPD